jgi:hypothetical protein
VKSTPATPASPPGHTSRTCSAASLPGSRARGGVIDISTCRIFSGRLGRRRTRLRGRRRRVHRQVLSNMPAGWRWVREPAGVAVFGLLGFFFLHDRILEPN